MRKYWFIFGVVVAIGLTIRILPIGRVFDGEAVRFACPDSYFHATLVQLIANNYPHLVPNELFTPYGPPLLYPYQAYDWIVATSAQVAGLGNPSDYLIDTTTAWAPVFIYLFTIPAVYLIGRALCRSKMVAIVSASIFCIIHGEYLRRSLIGASDHHAVEVLLTTWLVVAVIYFLRPDLDKKCKVIMALVAVALIALFMKVWAGYWLFLLILAGFYLIFTAVKLIRQFTWGRAMVFLMSLPVFALFFHERLSHLWQYFEPGNLMLELTMETMGGLNIHNLDVLFDVGMGIILLAGLYTAFAKKWFDSPCPMGINLLAVWTIAIMVMTVIVRRFDYYMAVPLSLFFAFWIYGFYSLWSRVFSPAFAKRVICVVCALLLLFWAGISTIIAVQHDYLGKHWQEALVWMRWNTEQDAVIATWWDNGYWIMHVAKRLPTCNPAQDTCSVRRTARLFMSKKELPTQELQDIKADYVILDKETVEHKLWAMARWNGENYKDYVEAKIVLGQGRTTTYKPPYYDTWAVRLFNSSSNCGTLGVQLIYDKGGVKIWWVIDEKGIVPFWCLRILSEWN